MLVLEMLIYALVNSAFSHFASLKIPLVIQLQVKVAASNRFYWATTFIFYVD